MSKKSFDNLVDCCVLVQPHWTPLRRKLATAHGLPPLTAHQLIPPWAKGDRGPKQTEIRRSAWVQRGVLCRNVRCNHPKFPPLKAFRLGSVSITGAARGYRDLSDRLLSIFELYDLLRSPRSLSNIAIFSLSVFSSSSYSRSFFSLRRLRSSTASTYLSSGLKVHWLFIACA